jgi:hypothetical protein
VSARHTKRNIYDGNEHGRGSAITLLETLQLFTHCRYASIIFQWLPLRQQRGRKHRQLETPQPRRQEMWALSSSKPPMAWEEPIAFIFKTLLAQVCTNVILKCGKMLLFVKKMAVTWTHCRGVMPATPLLCCFI